MQNSLPLPPPSTPSTSPSLSVSSHTVLSCIGWCFVFYVAYYVLIDAFYIKILFPRYWPGDWLGRASPERPILCRVGCKT